MWGGKNLGRVLCASCDIGLSIFLLNLMSNAYQHISSELITCNFPVVEGLAKQQNEDVRHQKLTASCQVDQDNKRTVFAGYHRLQRGQKLTQLTYPSKVYPEERGLLNYQKKDLFI